jgi:hypothetical protein
VDGGALPVERRTPVHVRGTVAHETVHSARSMDESAHRCWQRSARETAACAGRFDTRRYPALATRRHDADVWRTH